MCVDQVFEKHLYTLILVLILKNVDVPMHDACGGFCITLVIQLSRI